MFDFFFLFLNAFYNRNDFKKPKKDSNLLIIINHRSTWHIITHQPRRPNPHANSPQILNTNHSKGEERPKIKGPIDIGWWQKRGSKNTSNFFLSLFFFIWSGNAYMKRFQRGWSQLCLQLFPRLACTDFPSLSRLTLLHSETPMHPSSAAHCGRPTASGNSSWLHQTQTTHGTCERTDHHTWMKYKNHLQIFNYHHEMMPKTQDSSVSRVWKSNSNIYKLQRKKGKVLQHWIHLFEQKIFRENLGFSESSFFVEER